MIQQSEEIQEIPRRIRHERGVRRIGFRIQERRKDKCEENNEAKTMKRCNRVHEHLIGPEAAFFQRARIVNRWAGRTVAGGKSQDARRRVQRARPASATRANRRSG